ncbi:helix-turn-helix domain-containing protein [Actinoplanes sp. NPDC049599]|uniref:helix-turn-helix domain-containing protein n=1 Tax=Actinoplanes sp. NPDC049599 TaxID=3363903 RepID=UPI0037AC40E1
MATDPAVRLASFTAFVRRALDHAKTQRQWSVEDVAEAAGISANTIYTWRSGKSKQFPQGVNVEAFCDALGIKPGVAFDLLWPGRDDRPTEAIPLGPDDDLLILARRLADPNVPPQEKFLIRETIRGLAARAAETADAPTDAPKRRDAS